MTRTTDEAVRAIISTTASISTAGPIQIAHVLTNYVANQDSDGVLDSDHLTEIETLLAAHFYARRDPQYREKQTGEARAVYQGMSERVLESTDWGQDALILDVTGTLAKLNQQAKKGKIKAGFQWLGKEPHEQENFWWESS